MLCPCVALHCLCSRSACTAPWRCHSKLTTPLPSAHGFRLRSTPDSCASQDMLDPPRPYSETIMKFVTNVLPFAALALVYVATQVSFSGCQLGSAGKYALAHPIKVWLCPV